MSDSGDEVLEIRVGQSHVSILAKVVLSNDLG